MLTVQKGPYIARPGLYVAAEMKPEWTKVHFK